MYIKKVNEISIMIPSTTITKGKKMTYTENVLLTEEYNRFCQNRELLADSMFMFLHCYLDNSPEWVEFIGGVEDAEQELHLIVWTVLSSQMTFRDPIYIIHQYFVSSFEKMRIQKFCIAHYELLEAFK
jgi:hypothetical protein